MNFLVGIICFILGFILGVFTRNILIKVASINNKKIIAEEEKRKKFKEKYDFADCFEDNEKEEK